MKGSALLFIINKRYLYFKNIHINIDYLILYYTTEVYVNVKLYTGFLCIFLYE